jgi:hypothetical protein
VTELRARLEKVGGRKVEVGNEVTLEIDADNPAQAMKRVDEILFALSWPPVVATTRL